MMEISCGQLNTNDPVRLQRAVFYLVKLCCLRDKGQSNCQHTNPDHCVTQSMAPK